ncbi:MAG: RsmE family RNA methyltransferase, partial [Schleiferiaceae bacterium]
AIVQKGDNLTILIGPEGDFSSSEIQAAISAGIMPVHLGTSRLRTETAALVAVSMMYQHAL